ncbi:hypothetical protein AB0F77_40615 [Streptomyces sp. NPDC026672]|uniref:hypothetical protein n=1 Tax=unclassified Streptomyces TaxID=2593676 RepID=UPI0034056105
MSAPAVPVNAELAGRRVEEVLDRLTATGDPTAVAAAEELVRSLMEFYGAGLARIVQLLAVPADSRFREALLGDELVGSLLVLHDLHPEDLPARIARALDTVPADVEVVTLDETSGTLRLRATAAGCGCASGGTTDVQRAAQDALTCFAPEVTAVELAPAEPALLQIGARPGAPA